MKNINISPQVSLNYVEKSKFEKKEMACFIHSYEHLNIPYNNNYIINIIHL